MAVRGNLKPLSPLGKAVGGNPKPWQPHPGYLAGSPLVKGQPKPWQQCPGFLACLPLVSGNLTENPESTLYRFFLFSLWLQCNIFSLLFDHRYDIIIVFVFYSLVLFIVLLLLVVLPWQHRKENRLDSG